MRVKTLYMQTQEQELENDLSYKEWLIDNPTFENDKNRGKNKILTNNPIKINLPINTNTYHPIKGA